MTAASSARPSRFWRTWVLAMAAGATLLMVPTDRAHGWHDGGHMLIARIAWLRLTEPQRQTVFERLKAHPHFESSLIAGRPHDATDAEWAFMQASTWADYVRPPKGMPKDAVAVHALHKFHRAAWHHVGFPYRAGQPASAVPRDPLAREGNIVAQIAQTLDVLDGNAAHDPGAVAGLSDDANAAVRICWLFHLVGDVHQPMNDIILIDENVFPDGNHGDEGGSLLAMRPSATDPPMRLHAYWDGLIGSEVRFDDIRRMAGELMRDPVFAPKTFAELADHRHPREWAAESYRVAATEIYRDGALPLVLWRDVERGAVPADRVPALSGEDAARAQRIARRRVVLAGYRLAEALQTVIRARRP
jgi:hypothetical protein